MEIWDLYTKNRTLSGKTHIRGEMIPEGYYHLVVHIWIKNSKGEYLISQRAASRPTCPLMWECVGGSVIAGESSLEGAIREVKEEVGLNLAPMSGKLIYSVIGRVHDGVPFNDILDVWLFHYDGDVSLTNATTDEVAQVKWMTPSKIKELLERGKLVNTLAYFFTEIEQSTEG